MQPPGRFLVTPLAGEQSKATQRDERRVQITVSSSERKALFVRCCGGRKIPRDRSSLCSDNDKRALEVGEKKRISGERLALGQQRVHAIGRAESCLRFGEAGERHRYLVTIPKRTPRRRGFFSQSRRLS
jgi:hypothetical protein